MHHSINVTRTTKSRLSQVDFNNIPFGRVFSDHMFAMEYRNGQWKNARIIPFGNIAVNPAISALHYGQSIFEGLKAYKDADGGAAIFRPDKNAHRLNYSARRMAMPEMPVDLFLDALTSLAGVDHAWIPTEEGSSLYIRPLMFASDEYIGIKPSDNFDFLIISSPVGSYYTKPVKVKVSDSHVRAFPGGVGTAKVAGNYAATMLAVKYARQEGYDQLLWMDPRDFKHIHEIGTMNIFFIINGKVITPTLAEDAILDGITRDSVIQLLKDRGIETEERRITIDEVVDAFRNGTLQDAFGTGTAATLAQISNIGYKDVDIVLPPVEERKLSNEIKEEMEGIKRGLIADRHRWMMKVEIPEEASAK